jgi:hypothetical protein
LDQQLQDNLAAIERERKAVASAVVIVGSIRHNPPLTREQVAHACSTATGDFGVIEIRKQRPAFIRSGLTPVWARGRTAVDPDAASQVLCEGRGRYVAFECVDPIEALLSAFDDQDVVDGASNRVGAELSRVAKVVQEFAASEGLPFVVSLERDRDLAVAAIPSRGKSR